MGYSRAFLRLKILTPEVASTSEECRQGRYLFGRKTLPLALVYCVLVLAEALFSPPTHSLNVIWKRALRDMGSGVCV